MSKNFATLYASTNDSIALEHKVFLKQETTRGELIAPTDADFIYHAGGNGQEHAQPFDPSPHRSGRHHLNTVFKKKEASWGLMTLFNIDTALGAASSAEIDPAARTLWRSLLGIEDLAAGAKYTVGIPDITFSFFENGDKWARQGRGAFVQGGVVTLAGDGTPQVEWSGNHKDTIGPIGIGKSVANNNAGNTVTLASGEGDKFKDAIGALVMLVEADGVTRSADTPNGSPRKITAVVGDVVTLDGAVLADADGSGVGAPVYLAYYEPSTPTAIDKIQTGLVGSFTIAGLAQQCLRNMEISIQNNHELKNNCYGTDSLSGSLFVPGGRADVRVAMELALNDETIKLLNRLRKFEPQDITAVVGSASGRRAEFKLAKVQFPIPSFPVPESGSVPVSYADGLALASALDVSDELVVHFK